MRKTKKENEEPTEIYLGVRGSNEKCFIIIAEVTRELRISKGLIHVGSTQILKTWGPFKFGSPRYRIALAEAKDTQKTLNLPLFRLKRRWEREEEKE